MTLFRCFGYATGVVLASCYYFPFALASFPVANSKMLMGVAGILILIVNKIKNEDKDIDKSLIQLGLWAIALSSVSFLTCTINNTHDYSFVEYFISMSVWLSGGYSLVKYIEVLHGDVNVQKVASYLAFACTIQCILALVFNYNPTLDNWSNSVFGGQAYMGVNTGERLHGIGCALDVAGFRFASVIIMLTFLMYIENKKNNNFRLYVYLLMFIFIVVVGNMISRSTIIGLILSLVCLLIMELKDNAGLGLIKKITLMVIFIIPVIVVLYNIDESFKADLRFGFEGFFSLVEKGEWQTNSNDILKNMVVLPDNLKTWIIGDGYAADPTDKSLSCFDPYYTGPSFQGFYMNTDVGYCRFIFYFGLIGLAIFSGVLIQAALICIKRFPAFKWMFALILLLNFIEWLKVSTDLFMVLAPFICIPKKENESNIDQFSFDSQIYL